MGHAARFAVYAFVPTAAAVVAVQLVHGVAYAFFFATAYIFVDEFLPKDVRASAQGLFNVMILGIGVLAANSICPYLMQSVFKHGDVVDFRSLFLVPLGGALVAAIALALFFRPPAKQEPARAAAAAVVA